MCGWAVLEWERGGGGGGEGDAYSKFQRITMNTGGGGGMHTVSSRE